jgi:hypothetical protein
MMEVDEPIVISEGDHESASKQKPSNQTPKDESRKPEPSNKDAPVEIVDDDDDEEEEGDEEAYAVEKVIAHKIGKKSNVRVSRLPSRKLIVPRANGASYTRSNGLGLMIPRTIRGRMKRIVQDHCSWWMPTGTVFPEESRR